MDITISECDRFHSNRDSHDYRVLAVFDGMATICQIDTTQLDITCITIESLMNGFQNNVYSKVPETFRVYDINTLTPAQYATYKLRKDLVDDIVREYAPIFSGLNSKRPKPVLDKYLNMKDEHGKPLISRKIALKAIREYLQSGYQDVSLLDQRLFAEHVHKNWSVTPGRKPSDGNSVKLLTEEDYENFDKYMKVYLKSEIKTQMNAYLDMVKFCYTTTVKITGENGKCGYKRVRKPEDQIPTYGQFNRYIRSHSTKQKRKEAKQTARVVRNNERVFTGTVMDDVQGPGHMCEVDAQEMDIAMVSEEYPDIPVGRPILYAIIDVMSHIILGVSLAMDNNSVVGLTNVFLNLVEDKEKLFQKYCGTEFQFSEGMTMDDVWPTGYRPTILKFDNGSDFISYDIARILKELNITPRIAPAATGSLKPLVEEFFSGIKKDLDDLLEHKGLMRAVYGSKHHEEACLTYSGAMAIVLNHVLAYNSHVIKSYPKSVDMKRKKIMATPANLWKYGCETMRQPVKFPNKDQVIYSVMQPEKGVSLNNQGIHFRGLVYFNPDDSELQEKAFNTGKKRIPFEARSDPRDMGHLYYLRGGELMCASVPIRDFRMASYIGVSRKQFEELAKIDRETKKQEDILNRDVRIDKREKNQEIIDTAAKAHPGEKEPSGMRDAREEEKAKISADHSVAERFEMHPEETMKRIAELDEKTKKNTEVADNKEPTLSETQQSLPSNDANDEEKEKSKDKFDYKEGDTVEEIHRKMVEATDSLLFEY